MDFRKIAVFAISLISITLTTEDFAQTCKVRSVDLHSGASRYTEVFEYDYVDEKPEFPGGGNSMINFINKNRKYPQEAYDSGIEGKVTCSFIVYPDGKINNIQILRGVETSLNHEAIRIIALMPRWTPGKIREVAVPVRVICAIPFRK